MAEKSKKTWTYRGKRETKDDISHIWNRLKTRHGGYMYEINRDYPLVAEMIDTHPEIKAELSMLFRQIETGIPLNALYLDMKKKRFSAALDPDRFLAILFAKL